MTKQLLIFGFLILSYSYGQTSINISSTQLNSELKPLQIEKLTPEKPEEKYLYTLPKKEIIIVKKEEPIVEKKEPEIEIKKELFDPTPYTYNAKAEKKIKGNIYSDGLLYCYQVSAYKNKNVAEKDVKSLKNKKFDAFIMEYKDKKNTWYRVRVGYFDTLLDAENSLKSYKKIFKK
jgi:cell division protein FtsN